MKNRVVHFEIYVDDIERAKKFYTDVFGWEFVDWSGVTGTPYWGVMTAPMGSTEPGINGGLMQRQGATVVPDIAVVGYVCTVQVENIDETIKKVESAGGTMAMPKYALGDMAMQAYYKDTEGNIFGVHQVIKK
ncbi:MAG: Glyoxalase family protein [Parcubacteria bacterium C7867-006]|nr:MAG: Glyoxalase family protein [Parcubacteria bacterium C7867-006]